MNKPVDVVAQLAAAVATQLSEVAADPLCLAYSGGRDSTVLLHVLAALQPARRLRAVYVNHGLHPDAEQWGAQCAAQCERLGVDLTVLRTELNVAPGESLEDAARQARYAALRAELAPEEVLVTAHHKQDQLETVLLGMLRGGGVAGQAGMPAAGSQHGLLLLRPLLEVDAALVEAYARAEELEWTEDPSNRNPAFDRNFLRLRVLPQVLERWPGAPATVARSARLAAEAAELNDALGELDVGTALAGNCLCLAQLAGLTPARRRNALRWVVRQLGLATPSERQLDAALRGLLSARADAAPCAAWPGVRVRRYRELLWLFSESNDPGRFTPQVTEYNWDMRRPLDLPGPAGRLEAVPHSARGLHAAALAGPLRVGFRRGGETLQVTPGGPRRPLKKLFQEAGIVPWMRPWVPLLYTGNTLLAAGDLWRSAEFAAAGDGTGVGLRWTAHAAVCAATDCD